MIEMETSGHDIDRVAAAAWTDLFDKVPDAQRRQLGLGHRAIGGGVMYFASGLDHLMLNRLVLAERGCVPEAVERFRAMGVTRFLLTFDEPDFDAQMPDGALGLERFRRTWATFEGKVSRGEDAGRSLDGVSVRAARVADGPEVGRLLCDAFDLPGAALCIFQAAIADPSWGVFVAETEGEVVGAGLVFLKGAVAYLFAGATAPKHRGRGIQRALIDRRLEHATSMGASVVGSETGTELPGTPNPSWNNLVAAGLRPVHRTAHLCPRGARWSVEP